MEKVINNDRVLAEVKEIFKYLDRKVADRIPSEIKELINGYEGNYKFEYDFSKELNDQDIMQETKDFIVAIYYFFAADEQGKNAVLENIKNYEKRLEEEKNNIPSAEKGFENKEPIVNEEENSKQLITKKESIFKKLIDKILNFFRKG